MFKNFIAKLKGFFGKVGNWFVGVFSKVKATFCKWFKKGQPEVVEGEYKEVQAIECLEEQQEIVEEEPMVEEVLNEQDEEVEALDFDFVELVEG